ncbi:uncharacterized protein LOC126905982 [Daktulosphaira vitifoliae]|uniref:uncharacterized protein LOC126905982 n=1 Tax=Daktulosphaira vitifoliae TaxID=58002 RepID=UPI0021A9C63E|nr:uncharacterized protein LOC126905982 [Daktulosphaira vitifoliae]
MHLKTILIFCSFCFFTGIISEGLNVFQINLFEYLITDYNIGRSIEKIQHALFCHDIEETYNDYNLDDEKTVRIFKILNFLVKVNKTSDNKKVEKLGINEVQLISNIFSYLDTDNDCLIDTKQFITLIDYCVYTVNLGTLDATVHSSEAQEHQIRGYPTIKFFPSGTSSSSGAEEYKGGRTSNDIISWALQKHQENVPPPEVFEVVTQNENDNENLKSVVVNLKKEIYDENDKLHSFSDVLIKVLFYKAKFNDRDFGKRYNFDAYNNILYNISELFPPSLIYKYYYQFF